MAYKWNFTKLKRNQLFSADALPNISVAVGSVGIFGLVYDNMTTQACSFFVFKGAEPVSFWKLGRRFQIGICL